MLAPRVGFEPTASRLTAERDKNLSAASGVAYIRLGAILTFLAAPNLAPKSIRNQHTTADALCPTTPFLDNHCLSVDSGHDKLCWRVGQYSPGGWPWQPVNDRPARILSTAARPLACRMMVLAEV